VKPPSKVVTDVQLNSKFHGAEEWIKENTVGDPNPTLLCLINKLLNPKTDDSYFLPPDYDVPFSMRDRLKTFLKRRWETNRSVTPKDFVQAIQRGMEEIIDGVRVLAIPTCYDRQMRQVRIDFERRSKRTDSLYSCPVIKNLIKDSINQAGGYGGCGKSGPW
jgi:hypothetical protein